MTTTSATTTVAMETTTTLPPANCSSPTLISYSAKTCSSSNKNKIYIHAALKVSGGGCLLFTGNGKYFKCNTITDVKVEQGKTCAGPHNIAGI